MLRPLAQDLNVKLRTLQSWKAKAARPPGRKPGRPAHGEDARKRARVLVAAELEIQGWKAGEGPVLHAIREREHVPVRLARTALKELKEEHAHKEQERIERNRVHIEVQARDALWSQDATELARGEEPITSCVAQGRVELAPCSTETITPQAEATPRVVERENEENVLPRHEAVECSTLERPGCLQDRRSSIGPTDSTPRKADTSQGGCDTWMIHAEVVRDVASTKTIGIQVGPPATTQEVIALLVQAYAARGAWPLVLVTDNGGPYRSLTLAKFLAQRRIVHLFSEPRTPQHNPWVEYGHRELKEQVQIALLPRSEVRVVAAERLEQARQVLDHGRRRRSRGWRTAAECDLALPPAEALVSREEFYAVVCSARRRATQLTKNGRERRRAVREAILATLESFGLITRTRGGLPYRAPESAIIS